jgi:hypothetical protein
VAAAAVMPAADPRLRAVAVGGGCSVASLLGDQFGRDSCRSDMAWPPAGGLAAAAASRRACSAVPRTSGRTPAARGGDAGAAGSPRVPDPADDLDRLHVLIPRGHLALIGNESNVTSGEVATSAALRSGPSWLPNAIRPPGPTRRESSAYSRARLANPRRTTSGALPWASSRVPPGSRASKVRRMDRLLGRENDPVRPLNRKASCSSPASTSP